MVRIVRMVAAPGLNVLLSKVNIDLSIGSYDVKVDPLNSVGMFIMFGNCATFPIIFFLLKEPPEETGKKRRASVDDTDERCWTFWKCVLSP